MTRLNPSSIEALSQQSSTCTGCPTGHVGVDNTLVLVLFVQESSHPERASILKKRRVRLWQQFESPANRYQGINLDHRPIDFSKALCCDRNCEMRLAARPPIASLRLGLSSYCGSF